MMVIKLKHVGAVLRSNVNFNVLCKAILFCISW